MTSLDERARALVADLGLGRAADVRAVVPLTGGVASDIARVDLPDRSVVVKFALARLRVAADWFAPVHRSRAEYRWLSVAGRVAPGAVPALFGYSEALGGFAMAHVAGPDLRTWKAALMDGAPAVAVAQAVAATLGAIHAAGAGAEFDRAGFDNAADFHALRVEPYLLYTAQRHPGAAGRLRDLAAGLDASRVTLVHGDVSPKNILTGGAGPVLLDAECATMGDPAFDLAFCANHLILKAFHMPTHAPDRLEAVRALVATHAPAVTWEAPAALEARVAALLPALMLARVDGKSPVEYLLPATQDAVRAAALALLADPPVTVAALTATLKEVTAP